MATARPTVSVYSAKDASPSKKAITLPCVFSAPLRADLVRSVHSNMSKNRRQAYAVKFEAGYDTAAASWGTGRAVARIPRVPGGGTHRSGQGAFGNMCRGGGMFNPTKVWRRWHRKVNVSMKRGAVCCGIAASAVPALVEARGHKISKVPEMPLVISDDANKISKTKDAMELLKKLGCAEDLEKVVDSRKIKAGRGKTRNRRFTMRKGPLLVHAMGKEECQEAGLSKAFRNIRGVDLIHVDRLNLLELAPGGSIGRFCIYTQGAIKRLQSLFGTLKAGSSEKKGFTLPRPMLLNTDISRIINSTEVQSVLLPKKEPIRHITVRKNALKNNSALGKLCPFAPAEKRRAALLHKKDSFVAKKRALQVKKSEGLKKKHGKKSKAFMKNLMDAHVVVAPKKEEKAEEAKE